MKETKTMSKQRPVHEVKLGRIRAAIWANEGENGTRHNVTFSRLFHDGDQWKDSSSFSREDLLVLEKVAALAYLWIHQQKAEQQHAQEGEDTK